MEGTWCHHATCVEAKKSREGSVSVPCPDKILDNFSPNGYLGCVPRIKTFCCFDMRLYMTSMLIDREWAGLEKRSHLRRSMRVGVGWFGEGSHLE
jgi:hypothetical protein